MGTIYEDEYWSETIYNQQPLKMPNRTTVPGIAKLKSLRNGDFYNDKYDIVYFVPVGAISVGEK